MASSSRTRRAGKAASKTGVRLLLTCVGRRVELLRAFQRAGETLNLRLTIHGADASPMAPAIHLVDKAHGVRPIHAGRYVDSLLSIVRQEKIDILIPLLDDELPIIAAGVSRFADFGCRAIISSEQVVKTCRDKLNTFFALSAAGIDTPATRLWEDAVKRKRHRFPYFLKPRTGSAAAGNYVVRSLDELHTFGRRIEHPIVQEFVEGREHTLDVYTGFDGRPRCVVPRKRLEVRNGEVSKGLIVKDPSVMAAGRHVAEALGECRGVITVQCIVTPKGRIRVIEVNPRFGGGVPLAIHAGADFPRWILAEHLGLRPRISASSYKDDILMLRFDDSVFVTKGSRRCGIS